MHSLLRVFGEMGCRTAWIFLLVASVVHGDYRNDDGGFMPSPSYRTEDQLAEPSARVDKSREERERGERDNQPERTQRFGISTYGPSGGQVRADKSREERERDNQPERTQRFGISTYGPSGGQGPYGGTSPGIYGPVKIDLGGVLIGSILGFGAVLILPKIMHALSYGYGGGYGRSTEPDFHQVTDMLNKLDETLARYNIDSAACMQRLACSYVQLANENTITGNATDFDALLTNLSSNSLIRRMLDGTSIYEAMSAGQSLDNNCQTLYPKCKLDKKTVVKMLTQLVPST